MYPKYFEQYSRLMRWYEKLKELHKGIPMPYKSYVPDPVLENELLRDVAYAFFQNCHHFHEWLGGDKTTPVSRDDTRTFISYNDCLMICADLCNGTKHIELTKPRTGDSRIRIDKISTIYSPDREAGLTVRKHRCTISFKRNNINEERDALDLAIECIEKWNQYMAQNKIPIPREQEGDPSKDIIPLIVDAMIKKENLEGVVTGPSGKQTAVCFLVDSGATYTLLPCKDWQLIGLSPKRSATFTVADGTTIDRKVSECHIQLPQGEGHTPVILGEPGDEPLLGFVTLEILGLVLNPFNRTLQPMRMLLACGSGHCEVKTKTTAETRRAQRNAEKETASG